jgi:uncharacterized protein HemX
MDPLIASLANIGGVGILAACLFLLHRESIARFTKELQEERHQNALQLASERAAAQDQFKVFIELKNQQHQQLVTMLVAQDKVLTRLDERVRPNGNPPRPVTEDC